MTALKKKSTGKKWSAKVTEHSDALDLEHDLTANRDRQLVSSERAVDSLISPRTASRSSRNCVVLFWQ
jgi:hypothetical protein